MSQDYFIERILGFFDSHPRLTKWIKRGAKITVILVFLGIISGVSLLKYSKKPEFCKSCHYMEPFYGAWKTSSHNGVPCIECHYAPGIKEEVRSKWEALSQVAKYVTGTYGTKPWAEISDRSCLRSGCHDKRLLRGKVVFKNVLFDHSSHLTELRRGKRLRCTSCHSQIVQGEHMTVTTATCVLCHFKGQEEGKGMARCTLCHSPPSEPVQFGGVSFNHADAVRMGISCTKCHLKMTQGSGNVPRERCYSCHLEPERIAKYDDSILLHDIHITEHKVECTACHLEMEHKITDMNEAISLDCNSCHPDHHAAQKELYMGIGGNGVDHQPDPMFLTRVNCEGCHIAHEGSKVTGYTKKAPSAACMSCHGVKYGKMLGQWKKEMDEILAKGKKARKITAESLRKAERRGKNVLRARRIFEKASYNIDLVDYGKGVHNVRYSQQLIVSALDSMKAVLKLLGAKVDLPSYEHGLSAAKNECYQCHFGMYSIVKYGDRNFPHEKHVVRERIPCLNCHVNNTRPAEPDHGKLAMEGGKCASCHHKPGAACKRCHPLQDKVFHGKLEYASEPEPDFMAEAGLDCEACHVSDEGGIVRPTGAVCAGCHDESYADLKTEWQGEIRTKISDLRSLLRKAEKLRGRKSAGSSLRIRKCTSILDAAVSDGSYGVHNFQMMEGMLDEAEASLNSYIHQ